MKILFLILFLSTISTSFLLAQNKTELISLKYRSIEQANIENKKYDVLNTVSSANSFYSLSLNYGHAMRDSSFAVLYSLNYENISQNLDLSRVNPRGTLDLLAENYYQQPQFSQLSFSVALNKSLSKNWSLSGLISLNIVDDFFKSELPNNTNFGGMLYFEKKQSKNFNYGVGMLL